MSVQPSAQPEPEAIRNNISNFLAANGFTETMNNSLTKEDYYTKLETYPAERCVHIVNPLSSDRNVMRQTLLISGLEVVAYNLNRQASALKFFEYGSVYQRLPEKDGTTLEGYEEHRCFSLCLTGTPDKVWRNPAQKSNFFELKGYVEALMARYRVDVSTLISGSAPADIFAEGITYSLPGREPQLLATVGTINPVLAKRFGIKQPVFAAEINWEVFFTLVKRDKFSFKDVVAVVSNPGFWLIALLCVLFYSCVFPFQKFATELMTTKYGVSDNLAGTIAGLPALGALLLTPVFGGVIDRKGHAASIMMLGSAMLIFVHCMYALPFIHEAWIAIGLMIILGVAFSLVPSAMWPSVPKLVPMSLLGTSYSIIYYVQNIGLMLAPMFIGNIIDQHTFADGHVDFTMPMSVFALLALAATLTAALLLFMDKRHHYGLEQANIKTK